MNRLKNPLSVLKTLVKFPSFYPLWFQRISDNLRCPITSTKKFFFTTLNKRDLKTHLLRDLQMTLTFDLYVILFGQRRRFHPKWSEVSMINNKKVGNDFMEI